MSAPVLVVVEHDRGDLMPATLEAMTIARDLAIAYDVPVEALAVGDVAARTVDRLGEFGAGVVHLVTDELLTDYGPEIWADCVTQAVRSLAPSMVIATGTSRNGRCVVTSATRKLSVASIITTFLRPARAASISV